MRRSAGAATLLVLALLAAAGGAQPAAARYDPIGAGATVLTLDRGFLQTMSRNGVKLSAVAPATLKGRTLTFPVEGGKFDPTAGRGVVAHEGALLFRAGSRSVPLKALQLKTTQRHSPLSVKAGGSQLKLATAAGLEVKRAGFGDRISSRGLALSAKLATRLAKKLRRREAFAADQPLGEALTNVQPETVSILGKDSATFTLDPGIAAKLQGLFVALNPIAPAERFGSNFILPIFGGELAPDGSLGTLETDGSIEALQLGGGQVFWQKNWLDLGAKALSGEVDTEPSPPYAGKVGRIAIADLSTIAATSADARARTISVEGAAFVLQAPTAASFNEIFAKPQGKADVFKAGEALGTITFTARTQ